MSKPSWWHRPVTPMDFAILGIGLTILSWALR